MLMNILKKVYRAYTKKTVEIKALSEVRKNKRLQGILEQNKQYKDLYKGKRCFVLGNGPSLRKQDLSKLQGEIVFTVNQFLQADYAKTVHSSYHFWADPLFFSDGDCNSDEIRKVMSSFGKDTVSFFESTGYDYIVEKGIDQKISCSFFKCGLPIVDEVAVDFSGLVSGAATVVQYAIELAIYMGFTEIYLLGCDMTGIINIIKAKEKQDIEDGYSYDFSSSEKTRFNNIAEKVSMESQFMGWGRMFTGYRLLKAYCDNHGILLANATLGGVLDNLPRVDYESLFK